MSPLFVPRLTALLALTVALTISLDVNDAFGQDDFRKARALHKECKQLKAAGKACRAAEKCEAAMKARESEPLRELTKEVRDECAAAKRARRKREEDEKAEHHHEKIDCPDGQEVTSDTDGHCCWPGQAWSNGRTACIGVPACPEGFVRAGEEACESLAEAQKRDADGDGVPDLADLCSDQAEDVDGFEDDDGCPDLDNDHDSIADNDDACPDKPEDVDGFEDDDGCPEEGKVVVEKDDIARPPPPKEDDGPDVLGIVGWSLLGVGGATVVTAVILDQTVLASRVDDLDNAVTGSEYDDIKKDLDGLRTMNQALFISGGVLAVGGLTMGIIAAVSSDNTDTETDGGSHQTQALRWRPLVGREILGGTVEVRW